MPNPTQEGPDSRRGLAGLKTTLHGFGSYPAFYSPQADISILLPKIVRSPVSSSDIRLLLHQEFSKGRIGILYNSKYVTDCCFV